MAEFIELVPEGSTVGEEEFLKSLSHEVLEELENGVGNDTPNDLPKEEDNTRMSRGGYTISDLTNWYSFAHKKWNSRAGNPVNKITIHHMAGNLSKSTMESIVYSSSRQMSCNYAIYSDGTVECFVPDALRSWCSSSWDNDKNAITIEVANNTLSPNWTISDAAYKTLIALCVDLCKRHKITPKYTGKTNASLTVHRMFSNTACPGPYIMGLLTSGKIEKDINAKLNPKKEEKVIYKVQCGAFKQKKNAVALSENLKKAGFKTIFVNVDGLIKVQVGAYSVKANAEAVVKQLKKNGFSAIIVEVKS